MDAEVPSRFQLVVFLPTLAPLCLALLSDSWPCWQPQAHLQQRQGTWLRDPTPHGHREAEARESWSVQPVKQGNEIIQRPPACYASWSPTHIGQSGCDDLPLGGEKRLDTHKLSNLNYLRESILIIFIDYFWYAIFQGLWLAVFLFSEKLKNVQLRGCNKKQTKKKTNNFCMKHPKQDFWHAT